MAPTDTVSGMVGGEIDSPSRNLARLVAELTNEVMPDLHPKMIYRADRFGRVAGSRRLLGALAETDASAWQQRKFTADPQIVLKDWVVDDWAFGVAAVSAQGFVSPTTFASAPPAR